MLSEKLDAMNILIAGDGDLALHMAELLAKEKHSVSLICPDKELVKVIDSHTDLMTFIGKSTNIQMLKEVSVKKMDLVICLHLDGPANLLTAMLCKKLGAKKCIAKVHDIETASEAFRPIYNGLGIDHLVSPEKIITNEIFNVLNNTGAAEMFSFSEDLLYLVLVKLESTAPVIGKSLKEIALENPGLDFRTVAIHRGTKTFIPKGDNTFKENDLAYVVSKPEGFEKLLELSGKKPFVVKSVMIAGGGKVGELAASMLEKKFNVTIFDIDAARCIELSEKLEDTLVINGDARNVTLLEDERITKADALVAVTSNSETNILTCLLAKKYGVKKTIALVENLDFIEIAMNSGIGTVINKKLAAASYITRFTMSAKVQSTKCLTNTDAEVFEFIAQAKSPVTKKSIRKLRLSDKAIIGGFIRDGVGYISKGDLKIEPGDKVVVFSLPQAFHLVDKMFIGKE